MFRNHAAEELGHFQRTSERINQLGGSPNMNSAGRARVDPGVDRHPHPVRHAVRIPVWGEAATADNDFCHESQPRLTGSQGTCSTVMAQLDGICTGFLLRDQDPRAPKAPEPGRGGQKVLMDRMEDGGGRRSDRTSPPGDGTSWSSGMPGDPLSAYREKRERDHTPEPVPGQGPLPRGNNDIFVIQEHHARRLHWDFRLERDGVLVSWALPRGLPQDPAARRLAVRTEDHPLEYASFEGEIPPGQYGAGTVSIWDRGTYDTEKWTDEEIKVVLHGSRASGRYVLIHTGDNRWLMHLMAPAAVPDQPHA